MDFFEKQQRNAFKPIKENPIMLDFSDCNYLKEIHQVLKKEFGLPSYYGENWDALWDCLRYRWMTARKVTIELHGYISLDKRLREYCIAMLEVFDDVCQQNPNVTFTLVS